jgi:hypothetical protein
MLTTILSPVVLTMVSQMLILTPSPIITPNRCLARSHLRWFHQNLISEPVSDSIIDSISDGFSDGGSDIFFATISDGITEGISDDYSNVSMDYLKEYYVFSDAISDWFSDLNNDTFSDDINDAFYDVFFDENSDPISDNNTEPRLGPIPSPKVSSESYLRTCLGWYHR